MAYKIKSDCISCGACEAECPVGAISAGADKYEIDPGKCIDWRCLRWRLPSRRSGS